MDFASMFVLMALAAVAWFWLHGIRMHEIARAAGRQACIEMNVQFLDDTVAGIRLAPARDENGRRVLRRTYRFEFSETGNTRRKGSVVLLGDRVERVAMEPYEVLNRIDIS